MPGAAEAAGDSADPRNPKVPAESERHSL